MAHSYYNHPTLTHAAESWLNGQSSSGYILKTAGVNAVSNSKSQQSVNYDNFADSIGGIAYEEIGNGTY